MIGDDLRPFTVLFRDGEGDAATVRVMAADPLAAIGAPRAAYIAGDALDGGEVGSVTEAGDLGAAFEDRYARTVLALYEGHVSDLFHHGVDPGTPAARRRVDAATCAEFAARMAAAAEPEARRRIEAADRAMAAALAEEGIAID
jgi:hypothetical protein